MKKEWRRLERVFGEPREGERKQKKKKKVKRKREDDENQTAIIQKGRHKTRTRSKHQKDGKNTREKRTERTRENARPVRKREAREIGVERGGGRREKEKGMQERGGMEALLCDAEGRGFRRTNVRI